MLFKTIEEYKAGLNVFKGKVVSLDVNCAYCNRTSKKATCVNVDDDLRDIDDFNSEYLFNCSHHFQCNTCKNDVFYSIQHIRKMRVIGDLTEQPFKLEPYIAIRNGELWKNSNTGRTLLINAENRYQTNILSNSEKRPFISMSNIKQPLDVESQLLKDVKSKLDTSNVNKELINYIRDRYKSFVFPTFQVFETEFKHKEGKILDLDTLEFMSIGDVPLAKYASFHYLETGHFVLDALHDDVATNPDIFNEVVELTIAYSYKAYYQGSIKPRIFGQIIKSSDDKLKGKYIELRLHPYYGEYIPERITDTIPTMYQDKY